MKKPSRRDAGIAAAAVRTEAPISPKLDHARLDHASMSDIAHALADGHVTAAALVKTYLARIQAYDRGGPKLNAVRALNPDALAIAGRLDGVKPSAKRPLAGIPILVKDNIATGDAQPTTVGALALEGARARMMRRSSSCCARPVR
ncbi:amidase family protein [Bradyrhizobium sp. NC92]|nr:amidase family protein [Bradyrhizobium sp. NC92]UWU71634.1 amidase family protein [Bradyrhizobium sp. NC92]